MKKTFLYFIVTSIAFSVSVNSCAETALEPYTYTENFETQELGAWAAYPHWEDTSYNEYFRVDTMVPGDSNISIEQVVTPYSNVDNYAGAQKLLDMYLIPGSSITLRYYLKSHLPFEFFNVRLAAGTDGSVEYSIKNPPTNRWVWLTISFNDFIEKNPRLSGKDRIKVNALAVLAKLPNGDPTMPFYFGLDDITVKGARSMHFRFAEPEMYKLSEWKPYIPCQPYNRGDTFTLSGSWPLDTDKVTLTVTSFTGREKQLFVADLRKEGALWSLNPQKLSYPEGLYLGTLKAYRDNEQLSETEFTIHIAPDTIGGKHPRLWFDSSSIEQVKAKMNSPKFATLAETISAQAKQYRENNPVDNIVFDIDQFPEENWLASLDGWFDRVGVWRWSIYYNTLEYTFYGNETAGLYAKKMLVKLCSFPYWVHPWFNKRGRFTYYPLGEAGTEFALGYDCLYGLMTEDERRQVREGFKRNLIDGVHRGYVVNNLTTNDTSNWVSNIASGSLMCQTAIYGDDPEAQTPEPYLTGALFKEYSLIQKGFGDDGGYGEPNGYYYFTMDGLHEALPAIENVFGIDMSQKLHRSYTELIWAGNIQNKYTYYFGKSGGELRPLTNWAWLLPKYKDPLLGWFYHYMKNGETLMDAIYDTENVPREDPFSQNPVRVFRDIGTTVFRSGWQADDFIFVMRTGPFRNHQFMDQGSFWLSDRNTVFIDRRHGSTEPYVGAVLYEPWYIQPVSHSTILIDGNHQSQRTGDIRNFAPGFDDYAFISHFLDGDHASFVSGDIGRVYWGKVKEMQRNIIYLKPRTLLMLDTVVPVEKDVDVTLLYQTLHLKDITAGTDVSTINKDGKVLQINHMYPKNLTVNAVETPHYFYTLLRERPLEREGMLTVTTRTSGIPLVIANLLSTDSDVTYEQGDGFVWGTVNKAAFCFSTRPGKIYQQGDITTDALALCPAGNNTFVALCTTFNNVNGLTVDSSKQITFEVSQVSTEAVSAFKYYIAEVSTVQIGAPEPLESVSVNGKKIDSSALSGNRKNVSLTLPAGEGEIQLISRHR